MLEKFKSKYPLACEFFEALRERFGEDAERYLVCFVYGFSVPDDWTYVVDYIASVLVSLCRFLSKKLNVDGVGYIISEGEDWFTVYYFAWIDDIRIILASADHDYWAIAESTTYEDYSSDEEGLELLLDELEEYLRCILDECRDTLKKFERLLLRDKSH